MLFKFWVDFVFLFVDLMISLLPRVAINTGHWVTSAIPLEFAQILFLLPEGYLKTLFGSVVFYSSLQFGWAAFEWIYRKIPGVS